MKIDIDKIRRSVGMIGESTHTIEVLNLILPSRTYKDVFLFG